MKMSLLLLALLALAVPALAEQVTWLLPVPGVVSSETAGTARSAASQVAGVYSVDADAEAHTVTVTFDDSTASLGGIRKALAQAGLASPEKEARKLEATPR